MPRSTVTTTHQEVVGGLDRSTPHFQHAVPATTGTDTKLGQLKVTIVQSIVPKASGALSDHKVVDAGEGVDVHHATILVHRAGPAVITQHHTISVVVGIGGEFVARLDVHPSARSGRVTDPEGVSRQVARVAEV